MPGVTINTWKDLLLPIDQDIRIVLSRVNESGGQRSAANTSSFCPLVWKPDHLPSAARLVTDLPSKMSTHLEIILDQNYSIQAASTTFTDEQGDITPTSAFLLLQRQCRYTSLSINLEPGSTILGTHLSSLVQTIYQALTGVVPLFDDQPRAPGNEVVTDFRYTIDNQIKILVENKSSKVFDTSIGQFMEQAQDNYISRCPELTPTCYRGYQAILGKLGYHSSLVQPEFCLQPGGKEQDPTIEPPLWSLLVYMLLVETHDIDDEILRQNLGLGSLEDLTSLDLESKTNAHAHLCSGRLASLQETNETEAHSGALTETPETMSVRCLDAYPVQLKLVDTPTFHRAKKQYHPIICLDRRLHAGWSTVYSSSKSRVVVKFAVVPGKGKAELKRQLTNEKIAYKKLSRIAGWVVPRLYGEYEWHGGRALVLSDEGLSLSGTFPSLLLIERLILFAEVYCMHQSGVEHGEFESRNVLRKKWSCFLKIASFGFSNVDHTCPGWRKCAELKDVWRSLQLDRVNFRFKTRAVAGLGYLALLLAITFFPQLVHVTTGICIL